MQLSLPFTLEEYGGHEWVYRDEGPYLGLTVFSVVTPYGIRKIDSEFAWRICKFNGTYEEYRQLRAEVYSNPHLHIIIKQNLVDNLDRIWNEKHSVGTDG